MTRSPCKCRLGIENFQILEQMERTKGYGLLAILHVSLSLLNLLCGFNIWNCFMLSKMRVTVAL